MLEIRNRTPYRAALVPGLDVRNRDYAVTVIKGTFTLDSAGAPLKVADEQAPIAWGDSFHGDPSASSVRHATDTSPTKPGTDVALLGYAYAPRGQSTQVDVTLSIGRLQKTVRVFGDRFWLRSLGFSRMSSPKPFERMSLLYERAFGGADPSPNPEKRECEPRNPVGVGFHRTRPSGDDDQPLPNLEDPSQLLTAPTQRPAPAGFGFVAPSWQPRLALAGTYDATWQRERCPLLPADFDDRFFCCAHPDLTDWSHLRGGEAVRVVNASPSELRFAVPAIRFEVTASLRGQTHGFVPLLDTIVIEPEQRRVVCTWRATFPCSRQLLNIEYVRIKQIERSA